MIHSTLVNANILIVDDQKVNIDILEGFLDIQGYTNLCSVTDPREVMNQYNSFHPDLILLDLSMPFLNGFEVMEQLRSVVPDDDYLPVLVLTADAQIEVRQAALSSGASDFLTKPFDLIEVGLRIKNLLKTRYLHQQIENRNWILEVKVSERTAELEKMNMELTKARDLAQAGDRLKTAFIQNISHEVRTPLNGILGFSNLLLDAGISDEEKTSFIPLLQASSDRLIKTISDYMDISLIMSDNIELNVRGSLCRTGVNGIGKRYKSLSAARNLELSTAFPEECREIRIQTDPDLFRKIISHLIDNAIKFTQQGSIVIGYSIKSDVVEVYVQDSGIGVENDIQEKIFGCFMQGSDSSTRNYEGNGLGLSISSGFLRLLGSEIHLESKKGSGSTFSFCLPLPPETKKRISIERRKRKNKQKTASPLVILIAEDDFTQQLYLQSVLKRITSDIYIVKNGLEAVEFCQKHPELSLLLMDIKMPEMNGYEATRQIRMFCKDLPIIAITAYAMHSDEQKAIGAGCDDYLSKPVDSEKLMRKLRDLSII
ncbi:MAG: response regulator [Bacteroidales bacterium]|nr:response regulator [Bacteroidales bacterium]